MKVNLKTPIKALNGVQMQEPGYRPLNEGETQVEGKQYQTSEDGRVHEVITIKLEARHFCIHALSQVFNDEPNVGDEEKYKRYQILQKIQGIDGDDHDGVVTLDSKEVLTVRHVIGKMYSPVIVGQIIDLLEGNV